MKKIISSAILIGILSACVATAPKTAEQYSASVQVKTGSSACPSCNKIKDYTIKNFARLSHHDNAGWVAGELSLLSSNLTEGYQPGYKLGAKLTTTDWYFDNRNIGYWIQEQDGNYTPLKIEVRGQVMYSNITGASATWMDQIEIPVKYVQKALTTQSDIKIRAGRIGNSESYENDGYSQKKIVSERIYGAVGTIPLSVILGLNAGVLREGGTLPREIK